ncbi:MAG: Protein involved in biosynthesis of mitomycin antibiotics/polyketide fumonisin, partial [Capsulimonas sp.]|nr:Protein involved in biosynthesis of mitomycin antibiotics/polyketide fumonisin [Capsulimonas sp.]
MSTLAMKTKLSPEQIAQFHREGYLMVEDVFTDADLQPVIDEVSEEIDVRAREMVAAGELSRTYEEEDFEHRLAKISAETDKVALSIWNGQLSGPAFFG